MLKNGIFRPNQVDDVADDAQYPCVARTSTAMIFIIQDKRFLVFHEEEFQLSTPPHGYEMIENANIIMFHKWIH